jgi:hypothetical protein
VPGTSSAKASKGRPLTTALETNKDIPKVLGAVSQAFRVVASLTINPHTYSGQDKHEDAISSIFG